MKRIVDRRARQQAILREPWCVICEENISVDPHHVLLRSQGGDDVVANLVGLCRWCHDLITNEHAKTLRLLGDYILESRWDTISYLELKLGPQWRDWIRRRLRVPMGSAIS